MSNLNNYSGKCFRSLGQIANALYMDENMFKVSGWELDYSSGVDLYKAEFVIEGKTKKSNKNFIVFVTVNDDFEINKIEQK